MKRFVILAVIIIYSSHAPVISQEEDYDASFRNFLRSYNSGDLMNAERSLLLSLESGDSLPLNFRIPVLNNLGAVNFLLGRYNRSLDYYNMAELLINEDISQSLGDIYINKAIIFSIKKQYANASEYFEKGIRIYDKLLTTDDKSVISSLSLAYLNYGRQLTNRRDYKQALELFQKSERLIEKHNLQSLATVYLNIAQVFKNLNELENAEKYYTKCISILKERYTDQHFRLSEAYYNYAQLLGFDGRKNEAFEMLEMALSISISNYGAKNPQVSLVYKYIGDHFSELSEYRKALDYYQKALISIVDNFNETDIFSNPSGDTSLFSIRLLDNLKSKALALQELSQQEKNELSAVKYSKAANETIGIALNVLSQIKDEYLSDEDRIYLAENEKETYISAIDIINSELRLTGETSLVRKMYDILQDTKASLLREEIIENELLFSELIPDSLSRRKNDLKLALGSYNKLIFNEFQSPKPDTAKISFWKDEIFAMNRELEELSVELRMSYPQYYNLLKKTKPLSVVQVMKKLKKDETIIDFILSPKYINGTRKLFTFIITRDSLLFHESHPDSLFSLNAEIIRNGSRIRNNENRRSHVLNKYASALNYMYNTLVNPLIKNLNTSHLIIIPDDEISWLPFDALIESLPSDSINSFDGLPYLINRFIISYGPSASLVFNKTLPGRKVYAFAPDYNEINGAITDIVRLSGANKEIDAIYRWFRGRRFTGHSATETNFRSLLGSPGIFHLAMHSFSDTLNSNYSYLLFETGNDTLNDGKLYNYEVSLLKIVSPMIVLSSCNSGTGKLYQSEGLKSLALSFFLAGASSLIMTSWEINDEVSAEIMENFYYYLAKGRQKDEAMRLAKLEFLRKNPPSLKDPYYWAAYKVMGNNDPVNAGRNKLLYPVPAIIVVVAIIIFYYFRRRRIRSEDSL